MCCQGPMYGMVHHHLLRVLNSQSCLGLSEACTTGCCRRKPLSKFECRWSSSPLSQGKRIGSRALSRTVAVQVAESIAALPVERIKQNPEFTVCNDHADMAVLPRELQNFAESDAALPLAEEEEEEVCLPFSEQEEAHHTLAQVHNAGSTTIPEEELSIIKNEKLRRTRISEANKGQVPWNKGKNYTLGMQCVHAAVSNKDITDVGDDAELLTKEKQRRQRIATANKGKVPWNKGRQHSEETRQRIRERTMEAMKNPKIREKLRIHGSTLSCEAKSKISTALSLVWGVKRKVKQVQETCVEEWKELIADAARRGYGGDVVYEWNSYGIIFKELQYAWRLNRKRRKRKDSKAAISSAHRIKISNAIKAKWADHNYRITVEAAIHAHWEKNGSGPGKHKRRSKEDSIASTKDNKSHDTMVQNADSASSIGSEVLQPTRSKNLPAYRNPLSWEMLEKLKWIRASRVSEGTRRKKATDRARTLIAEAQRAARALEAAAAKDKNSLAPLLEAQRLLAEAAESLKTAGLEMDCFLEPSKGE